ncbi:MAG: EAL domain-containing protein [Micromonosporaceae bacterium]|nr:EAL domain-containing protein [Micromonosporaceae bacterium]
MHGSQAIKHLAEFLAVTSGSPDEATAIRAAIEFAAEILDAEMGTVICEETVVSLGYPHDQVPVEALRTAARDRWTTIPVPGIGECHLIVLPLHGRISGSMMLARSWAGFSSDEANLIRAMARVLSLALDIMRTVEAERTLRERSEHQATENSRLIRSLKERQRLVDALSTIERAISRRAPLQQILDAITSGARQLLDDDVAMLRLIDSDSPGHLLLVSSDGDPELLGEQLWRLPMAEADVSRLAIECGTIAVATAATPERRVGGPGGSELVGGLRRAISAPVREDSVIVGSLIVASADRSREYQESDRQTLSAFAEHVSLALTDAKTVQAMHEAFHDRLTGLASRALFTNRLEDLLSSSRSTSPIGLLFVDLNRFKVVNDTLGHAAGDQLLVEVGERIVGALRSGDTAARFGGDEFAALLAHMDAEGAASVADRLIEAIRKPYTINGKQIFVNASVGIAIGYPGQSTDELLRNADVAMYHAKRYGDGHREVFHPEMHEELLERMQMEADLRQAIDQQDLMVHYQPIVSLTTGGLKGFEALARWLRPGHGMVPPSDFIPLSEETGLILPIGRWILNEACHQVSNWQKDIPGLPALTISVNLSARQLQRPDLIEEVRIALASSGLPADRLVLEITESLLHQDVDEAISRLHELKALGVRIAIDDFGTGYSSLSCLHRFPVDIMKIDKSFIHGLVNDPKALTFARTIVRLGAMLNLTTIAEGIEDGVQLDRLREARCDFGQGYYFARPLAADQARTYLLDIAHQLSVAAGVSAATT